MLLKEFLKGFFITLIVMLVFFSNPAFAYRLENPTSSILFAADSENPFDSTTNPNGNTNTSTTPLTLPSSTSTSSATGGTGISTTPQSSGTCTVSKLSPAEAKGILDIAHSGFSGETLTDGSAPDKNKYTDLNGTQLIAKDNDGNKAISVSPPTQAISADKFSAFDGREILGPFGIGLVLDDTLRVGKCGYSVEEQDKCRIEGSGTQYRTSGVGLKQNTFNALGSVKEALDRKAEGVTEEEYQQMQNGLLDNNKNNSYTLSVEKSPPIKNSFLTESYTIKKATNCNGSTCIISTYSSFDKYFNSWFSAEMVVSSFGPTLIAKASRLMPFGGNSDAKWLNKTGKFFDKWIDKTKKLPLEMYGDTRLASWKRALINNPEVKQFNDKFTIQAKLFSTEGGGLFTDMMKEGSDFRKMSPESKQAFFKAFDDLRSWIREENARVQSSAAAWAKIAKDSASTATAAEKTAATIEFGQQMANSMVRYDDETALDFVQWVKDSGALGDMAQVNFKRKAFGEGTGIINMAADKPFNLKGVMKEFAANGNWKGWETSYVGNALDVDALGNIIMYEIKPDKLIQSAVSVDDLTKYLAKQQGAGTLSVRIPTTNDIYELNDATVSLLKSNPNMAATVDIVTGSWAPRTLKDGTVQVMTPEEFAKRLTQERMISRPNTAERNATNFYNMMRNNPEFSARKSWSLYDAQIASEKNFLVDYFKQPLQTGLWKGTALPIAYWNVKRGLGFEQVSGYMLPDTWTTIEITPGTEQIYLDSYTDLYANEGSDQGDMFMKFLNQGIFIYKYIADQFSKEEFPWFHDWLTRVSGSSEGIATGAINSKSITRDKVADIAFYSHNENCSGCSVQTTQQNGYLSLTGHLPTNIQAFVVEAIDSTKAQKEGTTLIAYAHHADIVGKTANVEGSKINIAASRGQGTTCEQELANLPGVGFALKRADPRLVGLILASGESLGYAMGFGYGITATAFQQLLLSSGLQDCVDDKDGYYVHLFSPPATTKVIPKEQVSNETMSDAISNLSNKLTAATTNSNSPIAESLEKIKGDALNFANQAKKDDILQANIQLMPPTVGGITGKEVFYIWYKDVANPNGYKTEGKQIVTDGNNSVEFNFDDGTLKFNGKEILGTDKADHTRLATTPSDNRIPGIVVPATLNKINAPNTDAAVFELRSGGDMVVRNSEVLDCIQKAIKDQSGITYSGDELTQVFGRLQGINTSTYAKVFASDGKIYLEGTGPRVQGGTSSAFLIDGFWNSKLIVDSNSTVEAGKFKGMTFEYGTIVLKPETNEIIIWLRQHKEAILSNQEVSGLKGKLSSITDPANGCDTPAITLAASGNPGDELGQQRVQNFNTSMNQLGPFTQFVTDSKIYEFYTQKDPTTAECKQFFRVIDKNSGKVLYEGEIQGGVKQDENGKLSFTTADGKQHSLDFSAENGVPMVSYNNGPKETLRAAQGPNGSFWYDPNTGLWYPENGLQIPLSQAFKDNGTMYASDGKGGVVGTPVNPMTFNIGGQAGQGLNIPSLPETVAGLILFISAFLLVSFFMTQRKRKF